MRRSLARALPAYTCHTTFPSACPLLRLDRVYLWPRSALVGSYTDREAHAISDHLPVIADIRLMPCAATQPFKTGEKLALSETTSRPNGPSTISPGLMNS